MFDELKRKTSNKITKFLGKDDSHEFKPILVEIEDNPVSPLGRSVFWIIVLIILFTSLWMYFGKVDVVISARGKIIPDGEIKILQPLSVGTIDSILVKEGDFVKKGQVVMEINPSTIEPELQSAQKNLGHLALEMDRISALSNGGGFSARSNSGNAKTQSDIYNSTAQSLQSRLLSKQIELKNIDERIKATTAEQNNYKVLLSTAYEKEKRLKPVADIIAKDDYVKVTNDIATYESRIDSATHKLQELSQQKEQAAEEVDYIKQSFKSEQLMQLSEKQKQSTELVAKVEEATYRNTKQKIVSPVDGYVNTLMIHTVGGVVSPAEKLMSIVPDKTPVVVKATVLSKDIGLIQEGMPVSIKIDTFEFQKYGILKGKVKTIAKTSIDDEKLGPVYEVYVIPIDTSVKVEGRQRSISPGMSLTAEIKIQKRRVIEFFIYPLIKYWNEGITVR